MSRQQAMQKSSISANISSAANMRIKCPSIGNRLLATKLRSTFHLLFQSCMTVVVCCAAPLATIAGHSVTSGHLVLGLSLSLSIRSKSVPNMLKGFSSFSEAGLMECSS